MGVLKRIRKELYPAETQTKMITLRVPEDLLKAFQKAAKEEGMDRSAGIKALMTAYVEGRIRLGP